MGIRKLLPRYYKAHGENPTYTILRSVVIDGHEVSWMKGEGKVTYDITGEGKEGNAYEFYTVHCECYFTEHVGWEVRRGGRRGRDEDEEYVTGLMGRDKCLFLDVANHLRRLELRRELTQKYGGTWGSAGPDELPEVIADLTHRVQDGEWIGEEGNGAAFWGGYFYLQTLADILDWPMSLAWEWADRLVREKKISLEGAVVQPYREPPPPTWEEYARLEKEGYVGIASLPTHSKMAQEWRIEIRRPDGKQAGFFPGLALTHQPTFGPDVDDVNRAEKRISELIDQLIAGSTDDGGSGTITESEPEPAQ